MLWFWICDSLFCSCDCCTDTALFLRKSDSRLVGIARFELATTCSQSKYATSYTISLFCLTALTSGETVVTNEKIITTLYCLTCGTWKIRTSVTHEICVVLYRWATVPFSHGSHEWWERNETTKLILTNTYNYRMIYVERGSLELPTLGLKIRCSANWANVLGNLTALPSGWFHPIFTKLF